MSRILVVETAPRTLRVIEACLGEMGYTLVTVEDKERLRIELRAGPVALLMVSDDACEGLALDFVREMYPEVSEPVPVLAWSSRRSQQQLKDGAPIELLISGFLSFPLDPGEVAQLVTGTVTPPDLARASRILHDLRQDALSSGVRLDPPSGTQPLRQAPLARQMFAIDRNDWSGRLRVVGGKVTTDFWFELGQLAHAASAGKRDLLQTCIAEGRLDPAAVPAYPLRSVEEEVGLLMALRAIGMHEVPALRKRTMRRLLSDALALEDGTIEAAPDESLKDELDPVPVPAALLDVLQLDGGRLGERFGEAHTDAIVVVRLPTADHMDAWGLLAAERKVLSLLDKARNKEITVDQLLRVAGEGDRAARARIRSLLGLLRRVGFIDLRGKPWDAETTATIETSVRELHRLQRANHFAVFGLGPEAGEREIRERSRELAKRYHPDTVADQHSRVQQLANAIYARVQEAYEVLKDNDKRSAYRAKVQDDAKRTVGGVRAEPELAKVSLVQGKLRLKNRVYGEAIGFFRDASLQDPTSAEAFVLLGWATFLADAQSAPAAAKTIEAGLKLNPNSADAWYYLGRLALLRQDVERARKRFGKALSLDPGHVDATREMRLIERRASGGAAPRTDDAKSSSFAWARSLFQKKKEP